MSMHTPISSVVQRGYILLNPRLQNHPSQHCMQARTQSGAQSIPYLEGTICRGYKYESPHSQSPLPSFLSHWREATRTHPFIYTGSNSKFPVVLMHSIHAYRPHQHYSLITRTVVDIPCSLPKVQAHLYDYLCSPCTQSYPIFPCSVRCMDHALTLT